MAFTRRHRQISAAALAGALTLSATQVAEAQGPWRGGSSAPVAEAPVRIADEVAEPVPLNGNFDLHAELLYLIEEEKLAHDVYQAMYAKYGTRIFSNITASEATHQQAVLSLLQKRGLADPRLGAGEFRNPELQALYNQLIAQGDTSYRGALEAGKAIEVMDITDLEATLAQVSPADSDVIRVMQNLLQGSRNHLAAFERQLSR